MWMPTMFDRDFFADFFDDPFFNDKEMRKLEKKLAGKPHARSVQNLMRTDVKETADAYEMKVELPGFKKEDVQAELNDGYLHIEAQTKSETEDKDAAGTYVRKERFSGKCSRTFYVGEDVEEKDIRAKFEDGTLKIDLPKKQEQPKLEEKKTIAIEG